METFKIRISDKYETILYVKIVRIFELLGCIVNHFWVLKCDKSHVRRIYSSLLRSSFEILCNISHWIYQKNILKCKINKSALQFDTFNIWRETLYTIKVTHVGTSGTSSSFCMLPVREYWNSISSTLHQTELPMLRTFKQGRQS